MKQKEHILRLKRLRDEAVVRFGTRVKRLYPVGAVYGRLTVTGHERQYNGVWAVLCACQCGKLKTVRFPNQMRRGIVSSCGCLNREMSAARAKGRRAKNSRPVGEASFDLLLYGYKRKAFLRGLSFEIKADAFKTFTQSNCRYCGAAPQSISGNARHNGRYVYNGIDRVDPGLGYTVENCVPCCKQCNRAKRDLTHAQFIEWIDRLIAHRSR